MPRRTARQRCCQAISAFLVFLFVVWFLFSGSDAASRTDGPPKDTARVQVDEPALDPPRVNLRKVTYEGARYSLGGGVQVDFFGGAFLLLVWPLLPLRL